MNTIPASLTSELAPHILQITMYLSQMLGNFPMVEILYLLVQMGVPTIKDISQIAFHVLVILVLEIHLM